MKRIFFLSFYIFVAYALLAFVLYLHKVQVLGNHAAFGLTLIPGLIMGTGYAFGESTLLGFLRLFPKDLVGGWSSGTGLAGLAGAFISIAGKEIGDNLCYLYLGISPVAFIYLYCFYTLNKKYEEGIDIQPVGAAPLFDSNSSIGTTGKPEENGTQSNEVRKSDLSSSTKQSDVSSNLAFSIENFKKAWSQGWRLIVNLSLVYLIEFTASNGIGQRITLLTKLKVSPFFKNIVSDNQ